MRFVFLIRIVLTMLLLYFVYKETGLATAFTLYLIALRFELTDKN